jgi:hypothetical protein
MFERVVQYSAKMRDDCVLYGQVVGWMCVETLCHQEAGKIPNALLTGRHDGCNGQANALLVQMASLRVEFTAVGR